jgi:ATP-dependent exoDNAse (exonuclease V) alpha subunit
MAKEVNKGGRPLTSIDWKVFDELCAMQCSQREIAHWFRCSEDTIDRAVNREKNMGFAEYFEQKRTPGKICLRRKQYEVAMAGNIAMLIWLGKQWLGQSEKVQAIESEEKIITLAYKPVKVEVKRAE